MRFAKCEMHKADFQTGSSKMGLACNPSFAASATPPQRCVERCLRNIFTVLLRQPLTSAVSLLCCSMDKSGAQTTYDRYITWGNKRWKCGLSSTCIHSHHFCLWCFCTLYILGTNSSDLIRRHRFDATGGSGLVLAGYFRGFTTGGTLCDGYPGNMAGTTPGTRFLNLQSFQ